MGRFDELTQLDEIPRKIASSTEEKKGREPLQSPISKTADKPDKKLHEESVSKAQPVQTNDSQLTGASTTQSTKQLTKQFTKKSVKQSTEPNDNEIVSKPKGFYITYRLDKRLNEAVEYLQKNRGIKKVDRSLLLNAMLDTDEKWTDEALDKLVDPIISILTSRLLS